MAYLIKRFENIQKHTSYFKRNFTIKSIIYLVSDRYKLLETQITRDKTWLMRWKKIVFYKIIKQVIENQTLKYLTTDWE